MLRLRKFPVAKNSTDNTGGYQDFPSKSFCLTMPKTFARKLFCVVFQKASGSEKVYGWGGGCQNFPSTNFHLTMPNFFLGEPFCVVF